MGTLPNIMNGQFILVTSQRSTGKVLAMDGTIWRSKQDGPYYKLFNDFDAALKAARLIINKHVNVECIIYDALHKPILALPD